MPRDLRPVHTKGRTASDKTLPALKIASGLVAIVAAQLRAPMEVDQICIKDALGAYSVKAEYKRK